MAPLPGPAEQLAFLRTLCDRIPNAVLFQVHDVPGAPPRFVYVSAGVEAMLGVTPEQVAADPAAFLATILPEDAPAFAAARAAAAAAGGVLDHTFRQRGAAGAVRWVHLRSVPSPLPDGSVLWNGITQDVTEARRQAAAREEGEARFRAFMDNSPALAWIKDEEGRYVYLNRPFEARFGVRLAAVAGKTDFDLWPAEMARHYRDNDDQVLREDRVVEAVEPSRDPDGRASRWWVFKFPLRDAAGRPYVGGMSVDVTERERVKEELGRKNEELQAALDRVGRLEKSLVTMCAWTRTMKLGDQWVPVEQFLEEAFGLRVSHGISDDALRKLQEEYKAGPPP